MQGGGRDAELAQAGDLVVHQGNERRDHEGGAGAAQGRDLVAQALAAAGFHQRFQRFQVHIHLAFVIHGATGIEVLATLGGIERRSLPFIQRIGRLHVVVAIAEYGGLAGGMQPVTVDQRVAFGTDNLNALQAYTLHLRRYKLCRAAHVVLMVGKRADAGNA